MILPFDHSKVRFQNVKIKRVSTALGGSMSILDEKVFADTGKEKFIKIDIPLSLARMFKVKYGMSQFFIPHEGLIMWYGDKVITIEKANENSRVIESIDGTERVWTSNTEIHFRNAVSTFFDNSNVDWLFDGLYVYNFGVHWDNQTMLDLVKSSKQIDEHGLFRSVPCEAIHFTYLNFKPAEQESRACVAILPNLDTFSISAPIWKTLGTENARILHSSDVESDSGKPASLVSSLKGVDKQIAVNLNFALRSAKELTDQFGYESIQPLQLPKMMIQLKTVNIPRLPKEVKATTDIGLKFTHALSWLLGMQYNATTPNQIFALRQIIKYLMSKGHFWKDKTKRKSIIRDTSKIAIPLLSVQELETRYNESFVVSSPKIVDNVSVV
jgi:hypothetical protein